MNIKNRNIVTAIILSLVTCGIYGIYWGVCLAREAVSVKDPADNAILEIILILFLPFVGFYLAEKKLAEGCAEKGIAHNNKKHIFFMKNTLSDKFLCNHTNFSIEIQLFFA